VHEMNINEYKDIYVFTEVREEKVIDATLELLGEAVRLKNGRPSLDYKVVAVVLGNHEDNLLDTLGHFGADKVINLRHEGLKLIPLNYTRHF